MCLNKTGKGNRKCGFVVTHFSLGGGTGMVDMIGIFGLDDWLWERDKKVRLFWYVSLV